MLTEEAFADPYGKKKTNNICTQCRKYRQRKSYEKYKVNNYFKFKAARAKSRATSLSVPFDLDALYLENIWTGICPVSGIALSKLTDRKDESAAELDRMRPELGYTKGNVAFLSRKINRLKNNASILELEVLLNWMKQNS